MKPLAAVDLSQPKLPPQNLEAEQSVLGAILLDNQAMPKAMELLVEEDFYRTAHRKIYRAMLDLSDVGEVIDQITLTERLKAKGELESVGGAAYLAELVQAVPSAANIRYHCKIVRDKAVARELIHTSTEVLTKGYEGTTSIDDLLDFAERSVFSIAQGKLERSFSPINQIIKESLDLVDQLSKRKEHVTGVPTGYYDLDDAVSPGATETCDSVDSDCDGSTNDADSLGCTDFYADSDGDSYGSDSDMAGISTGNPPP